MPRSFARLQTLIRLFTYIFYIESIELLWVHANRIKASCLRDTIRAPFGLSAWLAQLVGEMAPNSGETLRVASLRMRKHWAQRTTLYRARPGIASRGCLNKKCLKEDKCEINWTSDGSLVKQALWLLLADQDLLLVRWFVRLPRSIYIISHTSIKKDLINKAPN